MSRAAGEAERRRRARDWKGQQPPSPWRPARSPGPGSVLDDCPDPANHSVCPKGDGHDWCKPHPRPADHKYECADCGHYDLDDYM